MSPEHWENVKSILNDCLELTPDQRQAHLDAACAGNSEIRAEVESLLESHSAAGRTFLETSVLEQPAETLIGRQIGLYRVVERIGEGGMGSVYRAVRESDFHKQAAIKVVKRGMDSDFILARFRQERQILAGLDHPNIARLLDGGMVEDGRPYLVMEYVEGTPIVAYCDEYRLSLDARLELFRTVCAAVQYAHQNLVVHRDLKPGNILVNDAGSPKLLDFGIAKLLESDAEKTMTLVRMMSPECASPEQVRGEAITTSTDIYSLGVLLYQLLCGALPYKFETLTSAEITRVVCEVEPRKPSAIRSLDADLDNIVLKALHKEPARRYASAEQFSEDIRRHLARLPVIARPDTFAYRFSKFVRRHRAASAATVLAVVSLIAGMAATLWQAHRSSVQQQIASAVNEFLRNDVLAQASALKQAGLDSKPDPELKVRTALDRAAARIAGKFQAQPEVEAAIRQTIGEAYQDLGLYPDAQRQVERAVELRRRVFGEKNRDTLQSMDTLAELYDIQGKNAEAESLQSHVLDLRRHALGEQHPDTLASMEELGDEYMHLGKFADAETFLSKALELRRRVLGEEHPDTLISMNDLAMLYDLQGKYAAAEQLYVKANNIRMRVLGPDHPFTLTGMNNVAVLYSHQGKYAQAESLTAQILETRRRILGPDHPLVLETMNNLAVQRIYQEKYDQAEPLLAEALEFNRRTFGGENPKTIASMNNLAGLYRRKGDYKKAEPLYREALEIQSRKAGEKHPLTLSVMNNLASVLQGEGQYPQAEQLYTKVLDLRSRVLGADHPDTLRTQIGLASVYVDQSKFERAHALARQTLDRYETKKSAGWERFYAQALLGESLAGQKQFAQAEPLLLTGYEGMTKQGGASGTIRAQTAGWIAQMYQNLKKPEKAAEWRIKLPAK
ncbi:MAG TPA: serine/threonine-protein kinase [Bryobacteraceae bacterium]|jgi:serine/threonine protein kinase/Tfp pilus assembly protein PilF|nr:serine/threonine-protein kinase [Bryobacteraceae bacterium]